ncbi:MAG TPA: carbohydrate kinase family protein [bacterium]
MSKFDILVVGELNVDLILSEIPVRPQLGKEILAGAMSLVLGSSSAILASNIATLGARTAFLGKLGCDDFGDFVLDCLEQKAIGTNYVARDEKTRTGATIILNYPDDRYMITHKGAMDELTIDDVKPEHLRGARHLHLSSYYLQDGIRKDCPTLFKRAKDLGLTTSFDTNWDPEEKWGQEIFAVLKYVDVFLPNHTEALLISRQKTIESALESLSAYAQIVVIKSGRDGAVAKQSQQIIKSAAIKVEPVDTVGAGDSFNAGFLFKFLHSADLQQCLDFGNLCGALSVTRAGGTAAFSNKEQISKDVDRLFGRKIEL